ncbi:Type 1 glutamine amidotransferase-like domain-containing protein [Cytobacillus sp. FJAT-54145]|uniref:Type 1 glutamine amidotransferase-like domain-containing protein n=1 Tax=Cytobacillus spartinae TaxID=3299023 RepID=A0ABW6KHL8_9BACI
MNLVLLSNFTNNNHPHLQEKIRTFVKGRSPKLGYIPSQLDKEKKYFQKSKVYFDELGFKEYVYFDVDEDYDERAKRELVNCDVVYLSGGNTFYFLKNLQKRNIIPLIKEMVHAGKLLIGLSAGSIMMSETIKMAELIDKNEVELDNLKALHLVEFEFMPHWEEHFSLDELMIYSKAMNKKIYTCQDGDGIVVTDHKVEVYGQIHEINAGNIKKHLT